MSNKRLLVLALVAAAFGDACSVDENATGDGGLDASSDVTTEAAPPKDAAPEADVVLNTCDAGTSCGAPTDCPATGTTCIARSCAAGCCGTTFVAAGTACTNDGGVFCDGTGKCVGCNAPSDCTSGTACLAPGCSNGTCTFTATAVGTGCTNDGGKLCDGTGACVVCLQPSDCPAQTTLCMNNACSNHTCATTPAATGVTCNNDGGHVCDGTGTCVQCNMTTDCLLFNDAGTLVCTNNKCM